VRVRTTHLFRLKDTYKTELHLPRKKPRMKPLTINDQQWRIVSYTGEWKNGRRCGEGTFEITNGERIRLLKCNVPSALASQITIKPEERSYINLKNTTLVEKSVITFFPKLAEALKKYNIPNPWKYEISMDYTKNDGIQKYKTEQGWKTKAVRKLVELGIEYSPQVVKDTVTIWGAYQEIAETQLHELTGHSGPSAVAAAIKLIQNKDPKIEAALKNMKRRAYDLIQIPEKLTRMIQNFKQLQKQAKDWCDKQKQLVVQKIDTAKTATTTTASSAIGTLCQWGSDLCQWGSGLMQSSKISEAWNAAKAACSMACR